MAIRLYIDKYGGIMKIIKKIKGNNNSVEAYGCPKCGSCGGNPTNNSTIARQNAKNVSATATSNNCS